MPEPDKQQIGRAISDSRAKSPVDPLQELASKIAPAFFSGEKIVEEVQTEEVQNAGA